MVAVPVSRRILAALAAATVAVCLAPAAASAAVPGSAALRLRGDHSMGAMPSRQMTITLSLAPRNSATLQSLISHPHKAMTPAQFVSRFSPSQATVTAIQTWAKTNGLTVASVASNRLLVTVSGSSSQIGRAFGFTFDRFHSASQGTFFAPSRVAATPKAFGSSVRAVLGLSNLGKVSVPPLQHRSARPALPSGGTLGKLGLSASSLNFPATYGPKDFWSLYNAPAAQTGVGQQLAIITEGNLAQPKADLATFEQQFGLPAVTWNQINVGAASTDTSGDDEWDLDSQYSTGFAPGVSTLDVYVGSSLDDADILNTINRWVTDDIAKQGSFSAGECEVLAQASGFTTSLDAVLAQAAAQGQTLFSASGDTGSQCSAVVGVNGVPAGVPGVGYPASSADGIGVGGTTVLAPGPTEISWDAGGGGTSLFEPTPAFQANVKVGGVAPLPERGVPDVSLDADPNSGYDVVVGGTVETVGGTSASTPSWQGIWARAQAAHGGNLGFAGPVLYAEPSSAYNDITIGSNGAFTALPGWDYTTGLGTPNITAFVNGA
jgi:pseudomonalisin